MGLVHRSDSFVPSGFRKYTACHHAVWRYVQPVVLASLSHIKIKPHVEPRKHAAAMIVAWERGA